MSSVTRKMSFSIKPPGQQLKELLILRFEDLEKAAHHLGLYKNTLEQYLRSSKLGSDSFKTKLTQLFNMDFDALYLSPTEQISACINEAYLNFDVLPRNDLNLLEDIKQAASKYNCLTEYSYSVFLIGVQQRNEDLLQESVRNLCKAYILFDEQHIENMKLATLTQLAIINSSCLYRYHDNFVTNQILDLLKKAGIVCNECLKQMTLHSLLKLMIIKLNALYESTIIEEQRLIFLYFATMGYAHLAIKDYNASISYNNRALLYATGMRSMPVFVNNGEAAFHTGHSDKAFDNYSNALSIIDENDPRIYSIFLKLWDLLRSLGDENVSNTYWKMIDVDKYFELKHGSFHYFEQMILYGIQNNDDDFILKAIDLMSKKFTLNSYTHRNTIKLMAHIGALIESNKFTASVLEKMKISLSKNFLSHPALTEPIRGATFKLLGIVQYKTYADF